MYETIENVPYTATPYPIITFIAAYEKTMVAMDMEAP